MDNLNLDFETLCQKATLRLLSLSQRGKYIPENAFFWEHLDLGVFLLIDDQFVSKATLSNFGMGKETLRLLLNAARQNTEEKYHPVIGSVEQVLGISDHMDWNSMLFLNNNADGGKYGATTMLYPGLFSAISEKMDSSFYVLPSSIHELILIKATEDLPFSQLPNIVHEVNKSEVVKDEEFLSDNVYFYHRAADIITILS